MKSSLELLREYSNLIREAEEEFSPEEFGSQDQDYGNIPQGNNEEPEIEVEHGTDPVAELANYLDSQDNDDMTFTQLIQQFLKEKHYEIVPTCGLENETGNV